MKKYLSTGFIILLPFALTLWIISYLFELFTAPLYRIMESLILWYEKSRGIDVIHHETLVVFISRIAAFFLTLVFVFLLGYAGRKFFFKPLIAIVNKIVQRIPFVRTIYRLTKDVTKAMLATEQKTFKETVLIPFPAEPMHTLGFVTGAVPDSLRQLIPGIEVTIFVPTAPHPISGYVLFAPRSAIHRVGISVEDTFKFLLSCGVAVPHEPN